jgi:coiled-coil-helix-coiled-coil-helix domain-containing protein 3
MGASQSANTRRISVTNDDPASVIKVSESVVQRLKGVREVKDSLFESRPESQPQFDTEKVTSSFPHSYYGRGAPKTSLEIRQDQEAALRENDQYWEKRLKTIEDNHKMINRKMEDEYKKAAKEIEELFSRLPAKLQQPPCTNAGQHVKNCYQQNPREVLKCAKEVEAFAACVDMNRVNLLDSRQ